MNTIEVEVVYTKGYNDGYKAAERDMAELSKDKERLDWILNNYTLSCGITREEVDEFITRIIGNAGSNPD